MNNIMELSNNPVTKEEIYATTPEKIWKAITDKDQMKAWYFDIPDFELKIGSTFNFFEPGDDKKFHHQCTIKEIIPDKKLRHTWSYPDYSKGESMVTWEIKPEKDKTRLMLRHDFIERFIDGGKDFAKENFDAGWKEILGKSLKNFLEK
ncbi:MAG: SRPBCC domain-containing protein [Bacteroidales bacterium]